MNRTLKTLMAGLAIAIATIVGTTACSSGPSKEELAQQQVERMQVRAQAIEKAQANFSDLRLKPLSGADAEAKVVEIHTYLAGIGAGAIGATEQEFRDYVAKAHGRDAQKALVQLRDTKNDLQRAKTARAYFVEQRGLSGMTLAQFGTSDAELDSIIRRNALREGSRTGGKYTAADYKAADIAPNVVTKKAPAKKPIMRNAKRKAPAKKRPATRAGG